MRSLRASGRCFQAGLTNSLVRCVVPCSSHAPADQIAPMSWSRRDSCYADLSKEALVELLLKKSKRIEELESEMQRLQIESPPTPAASVKVSNGKELLSELKRGTNEITLLPDTIYELPFGVPVKLSACHCRVVGAGDHSTQILGNFNVGKGGYLALENLFLASTSEALPVVSVGGGECALKRCTLNGGRDGVYLTDSGKCSASFSTFEGNVRGVFESFRCNFEGSKCSFDRNKVHLVLLCKPNHKERASEIYNSSGHKFSKPLLGDIALCYNPVQDSYGSVFLDGNLTVLTPSENTTGLVDPTM